MISAKIGIALAGGGASGGAHVGVLLALEEAGIQIEAISGTSSGALVAGLFASGMTPVDMIKLLPKLSRRQLDPDPRTLWSILSRSPRGGLFRGDRMLHWIKNEIGEVPLENLPKVLAISTTNLNNGTEVVFASRECTSPMIHTSEGELPLWHSVYDASLSTAIRASLGIPFIFQPVKYKKMLLVDGGLVDNCPVEPLEAMGLKTILAVDTLLPYTHSNRELSLRAKVLFFQAINTGLVRHSLMSARHARLLITPPTGPIGALEFQRIQYVVEQGYQYTKEKMPEIIRHLEIHN